MTEEQRIDSILAGNVIYNGPGCDDISFLADYVHRLQACYTQAQAAVIPMVAEAKEAKDPEPCGWLDVPSVMPNLDYLRATKPDRIRELGKCLGVV